MSHKAHWLVCGNVGEEKKQKNTGKKQNFSFAKYNRVGRYNTGNIEELLNLR